MFFYGLIMTSLISLLAGCASSPNFPLFLHVQTDQKINLDASTKALPLEVRFYQLSAQEKFQQLSFRELWQSDQTVLGDDLVARHGWVIKPGSQLRLKIKPKRNAKYLGIMTIPREPETQIWRMATLIPTTVKRLLGPLIITINQEGMEIS